MKLSRFCSIRWASLLVFVLGLSFSASAQKVHFGDSIRFHSDPFLLSLSAEGEGTIYYTLNGARPTRQNATAYTEPFEITTTTPVSAALITPTDSVCVVNTRTYVFLRDVYRQPSKPTGYPSKWSLMDANGNYWPADYAMDTKITLGSTYGPLMDSAMLSIPSVFIVTDISNLFSQSDDETKGGIYVHTGRDLSKLGDGWERPCSLEYYDPQTGDHCQENCGLQLHGGNSRNPQNTPKHSFRCSFRKEYGKGKLKHQIFKEEDAVKRFDHLILKAGYNYTWLKNGSTKMYPQNIIQRTNAQYILDTWSKEAHHAMGHLSTHHRFVHLYLNGLYWGLYEICEKINDNFASDYLGGENEDFDVVDTDEMIDGERDAYNLMVQEALSVTSDEDDAFYNRLIEDSLLNAENFVDYMLVNWYIGNGDWDHNNVRCLRSRVHPDGGFRYLIWDAETSFTDVNLDKVSAVKGDPSKMMATLKENPRMREVAQRCIERSLTGDGILTPDSAAALYERIAQEIDLPIIGESARWGDYRVLTGETSVTYTRNDHWLKRKQDLLKNYFPERTAVLLSQLEAYGLYSPAGISTVREDPSSLPTRLYNLQGVRVSPSYRGLVVKSSR